MALVKYNPLNDFVTGSFGDLMESVLRESNKNQFFQPPVDILKFEDRIELHVVVPGMSKEKFTLDLNDNKLTISGERKLDEQIQSNVFKTESLYGNFRKVYKLSNDINTENINASYADGVLKVQLPYNEKKAKTVIKVK